MPLVGRNAIGARHEADDLDRLEGGGPRKNRVRPDIADDLGRKREDAAVFVEREFRVDDFVEPVTRRGKILQPVARPARPR
jgi:hypothetical protein